MELLALFLIPVIVFGITVYVRNRKKRPQTGTEREKESAPEPAFTVLYAARDWMEANLLAGKLNDAGIEPFLADDTMISVNPLLNAGLGGIKVKVKTADLEHAQAVLDDFLNPPAECPNCGSSNTTLHEQPAEDNPSLAADIVIGLTAGPHSLKHFKPFYRCNACGYEFDLELPEQEEEKEG